MSTPSTDVSLPLRSQRPERLSTRAFLRELSDELFSLDRGLPWTFMQLLRYPGATMRRYVEWRDPRLTRPLRYLLIVLALTALAFHLLGVSGSLLTGFETGFKSAGNDAAGARTAASVLQRFDLLLALTWIPALAAAVLGVYRAQGLNHAEAFVLGMYSLAQVSLLQVVVVALIQLGGLQDSSAALWMLLWPFAYVGWVCHGYFAADGCGAGKALRTAVLTLLSVIMFIAALVLIAVVGAHLYARW